MVHGSAIASTLKVRRRVVTHAWRRLRLYPTRAHPRQPVSHHKADPMTEKNAAQRLLELLVRRIIARYYNPILLVALMLTGLAAAVIATQWNINSDFKALLPVNAPAAAAMTEVDQRIGGGSSLFVVIDSPDQQKNLQFAEAYANKLRAMPGIALAHYHNDKKFFEDHQLLYMDVEDLSAIYDELKSKIREAKKLANPLYVPLGGAKKDTKKEDKSRLDEDAIRAKYEKHMASTQYKEYLTSDDGYALIIIVRFVEASTNLVATNKLIDDVRAAGASLNPTSFHPQMTIEFGGGLANRQSQYKSIVADIKSSAVFTVLGIFLVIGLYFRRARAIVIVLSPLLMGVTWALALAFLIYGELTTVTVFIFAVLLGLGIDFGIHLLSSYDHARIEGMEPVDALVACFQSTGRATVAGALTTWAAFVVLIFAQFRGFSQFGAVASLGILFTLLAMLCVLPSMILSFQHMRPVTPPAPSTSIARRIFPDEATHRRLRAIAPTAACASILITAWSGAMIPKLGFEENLRAVGELRWPWEPSAEQEALDAKAESQAQSRARQIWIKAELITADIAPDAYTPIRRQHTTNEKYVTAVSGKQSSIPTILLFDDPDQTRLAYERFAQKHRDGQLDTVRSLGSIWAFMPGTQAEQEARMAEIDRLRELIEDEPLSVLSEEDRKRAERLRTLTAVKPFTFHALPDWTKRLFREAGPQATKPAEGETFSFEKVIYVNEAINQTNGPDARRYISQLNSVHDEAQIPYRIGSQAYIYIAMLDEIKREGIVMLGFALLLVFLILCVAFRSPVRALVSILPMLFASIWTLGVCASIELKLDFFNIIIIPALIGIAVDDGVHFYMHYLEEGRGSLPKVLREVGGAIIMTSVTSIIGFGGLATTTYRGLTSIGQLAIVGIFAAMIATWLVLPATIWIAERLKISWITATHNQHA
jgi:predicted RND superfamily exporter protein